MPHIRIPRFLHWIIIHVDDAVKVKCDGFVISCIFLRSYNDGSELRPTKEGKAREARLQTATLSGAEYSMTSVRRFF